jgi:hypothetical protein
MRPTPRCRAASGGLPGNSRRLSLLPSTAPPDLRTPGQTGVEACAAQLRGAVAGEMRVATPGMEVYEDYIGAKLAPGYQDL